MNPRCSANSAKTSSTLFPIFSFLLVAAFCNALMAAPPQEDAENEIDFSRQILPILSNKCFVCHGPDSHNVSDLRLDSFEPASEDRGGYSAINPKEPGDSELLIRIHSADDPMPPTDAEKQLTSEEKKLLDAWVRSGGKYAQHWAFIKPQKPENVPSSIDGFIEEQLSGAAIPFAATAEKSVLARRAALVLTGLPPEPEQLQRYLSNEAPGAYEELVNQLLGSPRFGEHQARYWLDAVRYGDTHGLHLDNRRGIYPYRDWVVRALNQNLPFDEFIEWQVAGDLLPDATHEQKLASGFVRLNPSTGEGGAIAAEFQAKNNFDRVETFGTVFLGMSLTCARCHTHKYDPITQQEYYQLLAYFNNTNEPALDGNSYTYGAHIRTPADQAAWADWNSLQFQREQLVSKAQDYLADLPSNSLLEFAQARSDWKTSDWQITKPLSVDHGVAEKDFRKESKFPGILSGRAAKKLLPKAEQAVWIRFNLKLPEQQSLVFTISGAEGSTIGRQGAEQPLWTHEGPELSASTSLLLAAGEHSLELRVHGSAKLSELAAQVINPWDALVNAKAWGATSDSEQLLMLADTFGPLADLELAGQSRTLAAKILNAEANFTTSLVAQETRTPRETRVLERGEYDAPLGDLLEPGVLAVMGQLPSDAPKNRLGLADWLTSSDHPLVSRVLINRVWQQVFGYGLVRTPEDFGLQGQQPTHPELLDWLAVEFQESGWDLKHMLRLMLMSRTFQQSSVFRSDVDDPENKLYARGPSYRLDAEVLRDVALWSSNLLDPSMGGEGVKPYQPSGMWTALAHPASNTKLYERDKGKRLYRRSLYVYWKRTSPHPMMILFDAPDREASCVQRSRTNTPLQSLALFNETQRVEMARSLAEQLLTQSATVQERLDKLFMLLACRKPSENERDICGQLVTQMEERYTLNADDAESLIGIGESERNRDISPAEHAAWTQLCSTILASDLNLLLY